MALTALEQMPTELWTMVLQHNDPCPPELAALSTLAFARTPPATTHPLHTLGLAALTDSLMTPFVGRQQEAQRLRQLALAPERPGYHLRRMAKTLSSKDRATRQLIGEAYRHVLAWPTPKVTDTDLMRAMFVHDKNDALRKAAPVLLEDEELLWSAAQHHVQGVFAKAPVKLRADPNFALLCFSFDQQAKLSDAPAPIRDHRAVVLAAIHLDPSALPDASLRLQRDKEAIRIGSQAFNQFFRETFLHGRTDFDDVVSGLGCHIFSQMRRKLELRRETS